MCTSISFSHGHHYFGRNLDLDYELKPDVVIVPRNKVLPFKALPSLSNHHAIYGVGMLLGDYPFYYDCANEYGLCFAGLNFPGNAVVNPVLEGKINLAPYELPLYLLGKYKTVKEAREDLKKINLADLPFSPQLPLATLHYMLCDKDDCVVIEQTKNGFEVFDDPFHVLTNNPPYPYHAMRMNDFMGCSVNDPVNRFSPSLDLKPYGKAMGALGIPGDSSPSSRFIKEAFLLANIQGYGEEGNMKEEDSERNVSQCFHLLNSVSTLKGECMTDNGHFEYTIYSSIYDATNKKLFVKTYANSQLQRFDLTEEHCLGETCSKFEVETRENYALIS